MWTRRPNFFKDFTVLLSYIEVEIHPKVGALHSPPPGKRECSRMNDYVHKILGRTERTPPIIDADSPAQAPFCLPLER